MAAVPAAGESASPEAPSAIVMIGGGRMGEALIAGLQSAGSASITVVEKDRARRDELGANRPGLTIVEDVTILASRMGDGTPADVVLAVKPADVEQACSRSAVLGGVVAPGPLHCRRGHAEVTGVGTRRCRGRPAMPNTPALVGAGAAAISRGSNAGSADVAWARGVLEAVGIVVELPEASLDAVTGLSGSGPAYVFLLAEALIDAGVLVGLTRPVSSLLAVQTLLGAARMLAETGDQPSALRAAVTSPGGTTASGLRALEAGGIRHAVLEAVSAATERSRQLGGG